MYYCAQDIIEHLLASVGGGAQDSEHRLLRQAAHHGYRDVVYARQWRWHESAHELGEPEPGSGGKSFLLPHGVRDVDSVVPPDRAIESAFVTNQEYLRLESYPSSAGDTIFYTVMPSQDRSRWRLMIAGNPPSVDTTRQYLVSYRRKPEPLKRMGYERASRDGSYTAENAAGAVRRHGTADHYPEGPAGAHPFTAEEILGVAGSLLGTPPAGVVKTAVSDRLDISESMFSAVLSGAEVWLARMQGKNVEGAMTVHARDLRMAMEADAVNPMSGRRHNVTRHPEGIQIPFSGHTSTPRDMGYYSPSQQDTGT